MRGKKILLVITGLGMGGAEKQVCDLADVFSKDGHSVMLLSLAGDTINRPTSLDIPVVELHMNKSILGFYSAYYSAIKIINQFQPDIVHSHMVHANIFCRLLRCSVRIPSLICTAHSTNEGGKFRMFLYKITDWLANISTNVSKEAVDSFILAGAVKKSKIIPVYNGINVEKFKPNSEKRVALRRSLNIKENTRLLLSVGRLVQAKDYFNLLYAFEKLRSLEMIHLAIIGDGELLDELQALTVKLKIDKQVHFLGLRRDVADWMSAADVFVLSSAWEGFGLVVAEAMACERVVVATDCGGVREVVGDAGFLVPPKDSVKLAQAIYSALQLSIEDASALGKAARQRIESYYSLSSVSQRWLRIYNGDYRSS
ncbi:MAG: glycosyltransferase [Plesiomonas sp.]